jgi:uncharacterized membrane protein YphA (DoxX/SURF4 family)
MRRSSVVAKGNDAQRPLNIHRNNAPEGFLETLEATSPTVLHLAGLDWFRSAGLACMRAHRPTSGNLHDVGQYLHAAFRSGLLRLTVRLRRRGRAPGMDVSTNDRRRGYPLFAVDALAAVSFKDYADLRFIADPAMRLVASAYPLLAMCQASHSSTPDGSTLAPDERARRVLLIRRGDHVDLRELSTGDFELMHALVVRHAIVEATDDALAAEPSPDFAFTLTERQLAVFARARSAATAVRTGNSDVRELAIPDVGLVQAREPGVTITLFTDDLQSYLTGLAARGSRRHVGEPFFPVLLVLGLAGRLSALGRIAVNTMAVISYPHVLYSEGSEAALGQHYPRGFMVLVLAIYGPGASSPDRAIAARAQGGRPPDGASTSRIAEALWLDGRRPKLLWPAGTSGVPSC